MVLLGLTSGRHAVSVFRMRPAIMALREEFDTDYPLAAAQPFLNVDGP